eukprot:10266376-Lingulodinium_polyedra.AAC.1
MRLARTIREGLQGMGGVQVGMACNLGIYFSAGRRISRGPKSARGVRWEAFSRRQRRVKKLRGALGKKGLGTFPALMCCRAMMSAW